MLTKQDESVPTPESCSELFESNMKALAESSKRRKLSSIKLVSRPAPSPPVLARKISIKVLVKNIETINQPIVE